MRILFISNVYPGPMQKGKGTFNRSMISAIGHRHDVRVVSPIPWTSEFSRILKNGKVLGQPESIMDGNIRVEYPRFFYTPKIWDHHYGDMMWRSLQKNLLKTVEEFDPDVILSYWAHPDGEVAVRLGEMISRPVAVMTGGTDVLLLTKKKKRCEAIQNVLNLSDAIITVSEDIRNSVNDLVNQPEKTHVVYRGVNHDLFKSVEQSVAREKLGLSVEQKHFLFVGRLVAVKGIGNLIEACRLVVDQQPDFCCHLIGTGPEENNIRQKIQELGLQGKVILEGAKTPEELALWYQSAEAVILPSLSEGVPNVLLETISCGKSFIASRVGGIPEIADERQDILVPPSDVMELSKAIIQRMNSSSPVSERIFNPVSWDKSAQQIENILEELINKQTGQIQNHPMNENRVESVTQR